MKFRDIFEGLQIDKLHPEIRKTAERLLGDAHPDKVGTSEEVRGHHIESHTLGCMRSGDVPEDDVWDEHYKLWDQYNSDKKMGLLGDPADGKFVSISKHVKRK